MAKRRPRSLPDVLTADELKDFFQTPNQHCPTGQRNYLMLRVMSNLGLRVGELVALETRDLDVQRGVLKVRMGKGRKDRLLYFNQDDLALVAAWLSKRPKFIDGNPHGKVFVTLKGGSLDTRYVRAMVGRYARRAGIIRRVYPHLLRHTFATALFRQSRNLMLVRDALGHSDIGTTQIYTHLVNEELEAAMRDFRVEAAT